MRYPLQGPPESCKGLWYDPKLNRFRDEAQQILNDLSLYFPTWQLDAWKRTKEYAILTDRNGELWEVFYDIPVKGCIQKCHVCPTRCEIWELFYEDQYYRMEELLDD